MRSNRRLARVNVGALLVIASFVIPAAAHGSSTANIASVRIDNFGQVDEAYYRGARDYEDLAAIGIKTLINLTSDDTDPNEQALAERAGMRYVRIPMTTHQPPAPAQLAQFLGIVDDPANQPVYVHCVGGRHRTGVMTAAYRMTHDGWTADRAFAEMKQYKFGADFLHPEFKAFVYGYTRHRRRRRPPRSRLPRRAVSGRSAEQA